jgi:two-component system, chemotaxis family, protein-glutamate methylesterase/glutaminase
MQKIRVMVVEDSSVVRRVLVEEINGQPDMLVSETAANGRIALDKMALSVPDLVILDIEMPELDGLATLEPLRKLAPRVPVIMFSSLTDLGAAATLEALARGATDFFAKPKSQGGLDSSRQLIRAELIPAIRTLAGGRSDALPPPTASRPPTAFTSASFGMAATPSVPSAASLPAAAIPAGSISAASLPAGSISAAAASSATAASPSSAAAAAKSGSIAASPPAVTSVNRESSFTTSPLVRLDVVAIGASTGGPNAFADLFQSLGGDLPVPIVIAQHMPPGFTRMLAERLSKVSRIPTFEAADNVELEPGKAWIAPGDFHMTVVRDGARVRLRTNQEPPEHGCRPAVDPLFRSVAKTFGANTLAIVLTGMGQDGLRGAEAIRAANGQVFAQDQASSVVWGMPGFVARAGLADRVLPLSLMAAEILRRLKVGRG